MEYVEDRLEEGEQSFNIDSRKVQKALHKYANAYPIHYQLTNQDAQQGLPTSILSIDEHCQVFYHLMQEKCWYWEDFGISWNMCQSAYIWQDTCTQL